MPIAMRGIPDKEKAIRRRVNSKFATTSILPRRLIDSITSSRDSLQNGKHSPSVEPKRGLPPLNGGIGVGLGKQSLNTLFPQTEANARENSSYCCSIVSLRKQCQID